MRMGMFLNLSTDSKNANREEETATSAWRKSSYSSGAASTCVMFQHRGGHVLLRHSKKETSDAILTFTTEEWRAFILGAKAGEFDV